MDGLSPQVWARIDQLVGWLSLNAADFTYRLLQTDTFRTTQGAIVEIGVHRGKYLSLLAHAAQGQNRKVIGIDGFFAGYHKPIEDARVEGVRSSVIGTVRSFTDATSVELVRANSDDLSPKAFRALVQDRCAFVSIDGGHDAHEVYNDFRICCGLLSDGSIIAADDVFNPRVPGVAEGALRYLCSSEGRLLAPFATCGNKLFLCTRDAHAWYLAISRGFLRTATTGYLLDSKTFNERNAEIGFTPRMFGFEVVPFV